MNRSAQTIRPGEQQIEIIRPVAAPFLSQDQIEYLNKLLAGHVSFINSTNIKSILEQIVDGKLKYSVKISFRPILSQVTDFVQTKANQNTDCRKKTPETLNQNSRMNLLTDIIKETSQALELAYPIFCHTDDYYQSLMETSNNSLPVISPFFLNSIKKSVNESFIADSENNFKINGEKVVSIYLSIMGDISNEEEQDVFSQNSEFFKCQIEKIMREKMTVTAASDESLSYTFWIGIGGSIFLLLILILIGRKIIVKRRIAPAYKTSVF
ncbi:hypothetical protein MXB_4821 [Myxobolus squamalis]|nr:hypothetical protein MXB_4821 [Myxobolus squamalis]